MKKNRVPAILCAVLLFCAVFALPSFAQMTKVDEAELAEANASVTGMESPGTAGAAGVVDKTGSVHFTSTRGATETVNAGPSLNYLPASGPESIYYHHPWANNGTNQWYWGGGSTSLWDRRYP
jgi:hypothetical protein